MNSCPIVVPLLYMHSTLYTDQYGNAKDGWKDGHTGWYGYENIYYLANALLPAFCREPIHPLNPRGHDL